MNPLNIFPWFAGFFEDQKGSGSSKRIALYVAHFYMGMMVHGMLEGKAIDFNVLFFDSLIIGVCLGLITSEFFAKFTKPEIKTDPSANQNKPGE
jgi:hypothetical protein